MKMPALHAHPLHAHRIDRRTACLAGALLFGTLLLTACAQTPSVSQMASAREGAVTVFYRRSSGSLGDYDGRVSWKVHDGRWHGRHVEAHISPQMGGQVVDPQTQWLIAVLDRLGEVQYTFDPPLTYPWPLQVGKRWENHYSVTDIAQGHRLPLTVQGRIESWGDVTVPAGTFKAFKLVWADSLGEVESRWVETEQGIGTVKRTVLRLPSHPAGPGHLEVELLSRNLVQP